MILGLARLYWHIAMHVAQAISWSLSLDGAPPPEHMRGHQAIQRRVLSGKIARIECACGLVFWSRHPPGCAKCGRPFREHPVELASRPARGQRALRSLLERLPVPDVGTEPLSDDVLDLIFEARRREE